MQVRDVLEQAGTARVGRGHRAVERQARQFTEPREILEVGEAGVEVEREIAQRLQAHLRVATVGRDVDDVRRIRAGALAVELDRRRFRTGLPLAELPGDQRLEIGRVERVEREVEALEVHREFEAAQAGHAAGGGVEHRDLREVARPEPFAEVRRVAHRDRRVAAAAVGVDQRRAVPGARDRQAERLGERELQPLVGDRDERVGRRERLVREFLVRDDGREAVLGLTIADLDLLGLHRIAAAVAVDAVEALATDDEVVAVATVDRVAVVVLVRPAADRRRQRQRVIGRRRRCRIGAVDPREEGAGFRVAQVDDRPPLVDELAVGRVEVDEHRGLRRLHFETGLAHGEPAGERERERRLGVERVDPDGDPAVAACEGRVDRRREIDVGAARDHRVRRRRGRGARGVGRSHPVVTLGRQHADAQVDRGRRDPVDAMRAGRRAVRGPELVAGHEEQPAVHRHQVERRGRARRHRLDVADAAGRHPQLAALREEEPVAGRRVDADHVADRRAGAAGREVGDAYRAARRAVGPVELEARRAVVRGEVRERAGLREPAGIRAVHLPRQRREDDEVEEAVERCRGCVRDLEDRIEEAARRPRVGRDVLQQRHGAGRGVADPEFTAGARAARVRPVREVAGREDERRADGRETERARTGARHRRERRRGIRTVDDAEHLAIACRDACREHEDTADVREIRRIGDPGRKRDAGDRAARRDALQRRGEGDIVGCGEVHGVADDGELRRIRGGATGHDVGAGRRAVGDPQVAGRPVVRGEVHEVALAHRGRRRGEPEARATVDGECEQVVVGRREHEVVADVGDGDRLRREPRRREGVLEARRDVRDEIGGRRVVDGLRIGGRTESDVDRHRDERTVGTGDAQRERQRDVRPAVRGRSLRRCDRRPVGGGHVGIEADRGRTGDPHAHDVESGRGVGRDEREAIATHDERDRSGLEPGGGEPGVERLVEVDGESGEVRVARRRAGRDGHGQVGRRAAEPGQRDPEREIRGLAVDRTRGRRVDRDVVRRGHRCAEADGVRADHAHPHDGVVGGGERQPARRAVEGDGHVGRVESGTGQRAFELGGDLGAELRAARVEARFGERHLDRQRRERAVERHEFEREPEVGDGLSVGRQRAVGREHRGPGDRPEVPGGPDDVGDLHGAGRRAVGLPELDAREAAVRREVERAGDVGQVGRVRTGRAGIEVLHEARAGLGAVRDPEFLTTRGRGAREVDASAGRREPGDPGGCRDGFVGRRCVEMELRDGECLRVADEPEELPEVELQDGAAGHGRVDGVRPGEGRARAERRARVHLRLDALPGAEPRDRLAAAVRTVERVVGDDARVVGRESAVLPAEEVAGADGIAAAHGGEVELEGLVAGHRARGADAGDLVGPVGPELHQHRRDAALAGEVAGEDRPLRDAARVIEPVAREQAADGAVDRAARAALRADRHGQRRGHGVAGLLHGLDETVGLPRVHADVRLGIAVAERREAVPAFDLGVRAAGQALDVFERPVGAVAHDERTGVAVGEIDDLRRGRQCGRATRAVRDEHAARTDDRTRTDEIGRGGTDDEIVDAVVVQVDARRRGQRAELVEFELPADADVGVVRVAARIRALERERVAATGHVEEHPDGAAAALVERRRAAGRAQAARGLADDEVLATVAVEVAGRRAERPGLAEALRGLVVRLPRHDDVGVGRLEPELRRRREPGPAEVHEESALARQCAGARAGTGVGNPGLDGASDGEVVVAVAVQVAERGDRRPEREVLDDRLGVVQVLAAARRQDVRAAHRDLLAVRHGDRRGTAIGDDEIVAPVAVDVAGDRHREARIAEPRCGREPRRPGEDGAEQRVDARLVRRDDRERVGRVARPETVAREHDGGRVEVASDAEVEGAGRRQHDVGAAVVVPVEHAHGRAEAAARTDAADEVLARLAELRGDPRLVDHAGEFLAEDVARDDGDLRVGCADALHEDEVGETVAAHVAHAFRGGPEIAGDDDRRLVADIRDGVEIHRSEQDVAARRTGQQDIAAVIAVEVGERDGARQAFVRRHAGDREGIVERRVHVFGDVDAGHGLRAESGRDRRGHLEPEFAHRCLDRRQRRARRGRGAELRHVVEAQRIARRCGHRELHRDRVVGRAHLRRAEERRPRQDGARRVRRTLRLEDDVRGRQRDREAGRRVGLQLRLEFRPRRTEPQHRDLVLLRRRNRFVERLRRALRSGREIAASVAVHVAHADEVEARQAHRGTRRDHRRERRAVHEVAAVDEVVLRRAAERARQQEVGGAVAVDVARRPQLRQRAHRDAGQVDVDAAAEDHRAALQDAQLVGDRVGIGVDERRDVRT